jgi:hypothetical protein
MNNRRRLGFGLPRLTGIQHRRLIVHRAKLREGLEFIGNPLRAML